MTKSLGQYGREHLEFRLWILYSGLGIGANLWLGNMPDHIRMFNDVYLSRFLTGKETNK